MIHVDRSRVSEPALLKRMRKNALTRLRKHYAQSEEYRSQRRYPFREGDWKKAKHVLYEVFSNKCAYCEVLLTKSSSSGLVVHFRPKEGARGLDGKHFHFDHYWWLAFDWENLLLACRDCNQSKRDLFPVKNERQRAQPEARLGELEKEPRLILDPCGPENPEGEIRYLEDGSVKGHSRRAQVTIDVLSLNRNALVEQRRKTIHSVKRLLKTLRSPTNHPETEKALKGMAADNAEFAGAVRHFLRKNDQDSLIPQHAVRQDDLKSELPKFERKFATEHLRAVWPEAIHIRNFKAIHRLSLQFPPPGPQGAPWLTLVGPNAVGKSTVLEAMALALATEGARNKLVGDVRDLLTIDRKGRKMQYAETGEVRVEFSDGGSIALQFSKTQPTFKVIGAAPRNLRVLGYGPHRIPPRRGQGRKKPQRVQINNLFNPRWPLNDVDSWLCNPRLVMEKEFNLLVRNFRDLLPIVIKSDIRRNNGELIANLYGYETTLHELSSGYRALISVAADIIMNLSTESVNITSAQGVVLLDEIETHLHPSWKIKIVSSLRALFPSVRFIATTHDPLCLRGLEKGEIYRMNRRRTTKRVYAEPVDVLPGLTIDNLLTGSWFELDGTYDKETQELLERHRNLLRSESPDQLQIDLVEEKLRGRLGRFAETSLERQVFQVASEILAEESASRRAPMEPAEFKKRLLEKVRDERAANQ